MVDTMVNPRDFFHSYLHKMDENYSDIKIPQTIAMEYETWRRTDNYPSKSSMIYSQTSNALTEYDGYQEDLVSDMWLDYMGTEAMRIVLSKYRAIT